MCFDLLCFSAFAAMLLLILVWVAAVRDDDMPILPPEPSLVQCPRCHGLGVAKGDPYGFSCPHCGRDFVRLP